jgi:hypothetical protein
MNSAGRPGPEGNQPPFFTARVGYAAAARVSEPAAIN